jgi:hypothetical protein
LADVLLTASHHHPSRILTSPFFVAGLILLLANDFLLKPAFHNPLTGKLSDFSGLFTFPLFFSAFATRWKSAIYILSFVGFVLWKSPYSQPFIDAANQVLPFKVARTVDITDLVALTVLPLSWICARWSITLFPTPKRSVSIAIGAACVFAFAATSTLDVQTISYGKTYAFDSSAEQLATNLRRIDKVIVLNPGDTITGFRVVMGPDASGIYTVPLDQTMCPGQVGIALVRILSLRDGKSELRLDSVVYECPSELPGDRERLLAEFERVIIDRLREKER